MEDIQIVMKDMPVEVRGFVCLGSDYEPIMVINSRLSHEQQLKTYRHEMNHIRRGDMFNENYHEYGGMNDEKTDHPVPDPGLDPPGGCAG